MFYLISLVHALINDNSNELPGWFHPKSKFKTDFATSSLTESKTLSESELKECAMKLLRSELGKDGCLQERKSYYDESTKLWHFYVAKCIDNVEVANTAGQVVVDSTCKVIASSSAWFELTPKEKRSLRKRANPITPIDALMVFARARQVAIDAHALSLVQEGNRMKIVFPDNSWAIGNASVYSKYYKVQDDTRLAWEIIFPTRQHYWNVFIDQENGRILGTADNVNNLVPLSKRQVVNDQPRYRVIRLGGQNPDVSQPDMVTAPHDSAASPNGWLTSNRLEGNNARVILAVEGRRDYSPSSPNRVFDYQLDASRPPSENADVAMTNAFFLANAFHDIMYRYGFDEAAGNYQNTNSNGQGADNDAIIVHVQDDSGMNNANFANPADGNSGVMRLYLFNMSGSGTRDSALENVVPLHELAHGLTSRLTGGPGNPSCLSTTESAGMSEGWSDIIAIALEAKSTDNSADPKPFGVYVSGNSQSGVRTRPYSLDMSVNSHVYGNLSQTEFTRIHRIGEVWGAMLYEVYWSLVQRDGFERARGTRANSGRGNTNFLQLIVDSLKLQPCNPTLIQARNAMISSDQNRYQGRYRCDLWRAFAKRGLGFNAQDDRSYVSDFAVPPDC